MPAPRAASCFAKEAVRQGRPEPPPLPFRSHPSPRLRQIKGGGLQSHQASRAQQIMRGGEVLGVRAVELIMTAPLSQDLRERIVRAVEGGSSIRQAARRFAVSASAAIKLMQRVRRTGSSAPAKIGGARRPLLEAHADVLRAIVLRQAGG